jgi:hypothetical protein
VYHRWLLLLVLDAGWLGDAISPQFLVSCRGEVFVPDNSDLFSTFLFSPPSINSIVPGHGGSRFSAVSGHPQEARLPDFQPAPWAKFRSYYFQLPHGNASRYDGPIAV